ncbi:MAG: tyrosine-protein phosphatase [Planctomycetota bacterium]
MSPPSPGTVATALLAFLTVGCSNFHVVEADRVFRAAQPRAADLREWVDEHGIRTVVRLRGAEPDPELADVIEQADLQVVALPLSARVYPSAAQLVTLWDTFATAEYPLLIHCKAGADRTGLAAAVYVLQRTGDLDRARGELALIYGHTGWGTSRLDRVFEMYARWYGRMDFRRWASTLYHPPAEVTAGGGREE